MRLAGKSRGLSLRARAVLFPHALWQVQARRERTPNMGGVQPPRRQVAKTRRHRQTSHQLRRMAKPRRVYKPGRPLRESAHLRGRRRAPLHRRGRLLRSGGCERRRGSTLLLMRAMLRRVGVPSEAGSGRLRKLSSRSRVGV